MAPWCSPVQRPWLPRRDLRHLAERSPPPGCKGQTHSTHAATYPPHAPASRRQVPPAPCLPSPRSVATRPGKSPLLFRGRPTVPRRPTPRKSETSTRGVLPPSRSRRAAWRGVPCSRRTPRTGGVRGVCGRPTRRQRHVRWYLAAPPSTSPTFPPCPPVGVPPLAGITAGSAGASSAHRVPRARRACSTRTASQAPASLCGCASRAYRALRLSTSVPSTSTRTRTPSSSG
mmetsp:Transcript_1281/g.2787  ORF Transcript_1281/g.2787 Transcript_1281/m.2787 type:complete len:230 (+) Transcript_1281:98-787(+)